MVSFLLRRVAGLIPVLWIIVTIAFFLMRLAPGGPFDLEKQVPPEVKQALEAKYHLDESLPRQYVRYLGMLLSGDLGPSFKYKNRSVNELIALGFPVSLQLGLVALVFAMTLGLGAGLLASIRQNRWQDHASMSVAMLGVSIPNFVLGPILIFIFGIELMWLPVARFESPAHLILPGITLGAIYAAYIARLTRAGMLEVIRQDYVRTARAKGLSERLVILRHAVRGGLLPVISYLGPAMAGLFTGSLVVERIFNIPGMGRYFVDAALNRDYTLALGVVVVDAVFLLSANLLVDVVYALLDPRIRHD